jgi:stage III sporulation protein AA
VRLLSCGVPELKLQGCSVGVVDERGEIAASYRGMPQHDLGPRVDVLDHCPKAVGMLMLLRSMSPQVIATDEIGRRQDVDAVWEMVCTGVSILATVHASRFEELEQRPYLRDLVAERVFQRCIFLSRRQGPGTLEGVWDGNKKPVISDVMHSAFFGLDRRSGCGGRRIPEVGGKACMPTLKLT